MEAKRRRIGGGGGLVSEDVLRQIGDQRIL